MRMRSVPIMMFDNGRIIFNSLLLFYLNLLFVFMDFDCSQCSAFTLKNTDQIIKDNRFEVEKHSLETKDKYILEFFRIRDYSYPITTTVINRTVALLMHGSMQSSTSYVFAGVDNSLAFHLMKEGYDVWLGNFRGNVYGGLSKKPGEFWDFSVHEMGEYDLPAYIDDILEKTQQTKLIYIGYSMGTTAGYIMLSRHPEYNEKIERMISMAPVVFTDRSNSTILKKIALWTLCKLNELGKLTGTKKLSYLNRPFPFSKRPKCFRSLWRFFCKKHMSGICASEGHLLFNKELREKYYLINPAGISWKTISHFIQMSDSGVFEPYVYHRERNILKYFKDHPDPYDLNQVKVPVFLLLGKRDKFSLPQNIKKLISKLKSAANLKVEFVGDTDFNHLDFFVAEGLEKLVFEPVVNYLTEKITPP